jgi:hypothetical protein
MLSLRVLSKVEGSKHPLDPNQPSPCTERVAAKRPGEVVPASLYFVNDLYHARLARPHAVDRSAVSEWRINCCAVLQVSNGNESISTTAFERDTQDS